MNKNIQNRRSFLRTSTLGALGLPLITRGARGTTATGPVPTRILGKTGEVVSILGLGGFHSGLNKTEAETIRFMREVIDSGINFFDNAWGYHDGQDEERMGKALRDGYRQKVILMTKHHGRDKKTALEHLEESLRRLQTDVIDIWQFHEVIYEKDPEMIFAPGGGIEAAEQARKDGKVRYIGFTGHKDPNIHKAMLAHDYEWDTVQMPLNVLDAHYRSFAKEVLPICVERGIGVLGMKSLGGRFVKEANVVTPEEAIQYVLNLPISTLISGIDSSEILRKNIEIARNFRPLSEDQVQNILGKTREVALTGKFEPFKSTDMFDSRTGKRVHGLI